ncbi:MAG: hypothetical protein QOG92_1313 [Verrucomicrobiota bacterium]|nr:hypothetical protein [Verrucomicrobiota bacterium]
MSSRAFLNSFMLCPRLRAKSGNFFAPKRTRTMRRIINRSGPPRFPIPNASIFITILNWLGLMFYSSRSAYICFKMHGSLFSTSWSPCHEPNKSRIAFGKAFVFAAGCTPDKEASLAVDAITKCDLLGFYGKRRRQDCCISRSAKALRSSAFTSETAQKANPSRSQCQTL